MGRRKTKGRPQVRLFRCSECDARQTATKTRGRTQPGHPKDMYCWVCKCVTQHIQID